MHSQFVFKVYNLKSITVLVSFPDILLLSLDTRDIIDHKCEKTLNKKEEKEEEWQ